MESLDGTSMTTEGHLEDAKKSEATETTRYTLTFILHMTKATRRTHDYWRKGLLRRGSGQKKEKRPSGALVSLCSVRTTALDEESCLAIEQRKKERSWDSWFSASDRRR